MNDSSENIIFSEVQRFNFYVQLFLAITAFSLIGLVVFVEISKEIDPAAKTLLVSAGVFLPLFISILSCIIKLETQVRSDGLYVRFFPIHLRFKKFNNEDIEQYYARTYRPLSEYGGWGIRLGKNGKAYNISGCQGLQLVFKNNKKLLIGSKEPEEIVEAMKIFMTQKAMVMMRRCWVPDFAAMR